MLTAVEVRLRLIRYWPMMEYLDKQSGYGTYLVQIHGKRPVKLSQVEPGVVLEHSHEDDVPIT